MGGMSKETLLKNMGRAQQEKSPRPLLFQFLRQLIIEGSTSTPAPLTINNPTPGANDKRTALGDALSVVVTGAQTGASVILFPATEGQFWLVRNALSGRYLLSLLADGGSSPVYLAPGQSKVVWCENGELRSAEHDEFVVRQDYSLIAGGTPGPLVLVATPPGLQLSRFSLLGVTAVVGGPVTLELSAPTNVLQLLKALSPPAPGAFLGEDASDWGTGATTAGSVYLPLADTLQIERVGAVAVTAGSVELVLEGRVLR